jgi:hypothetical protein
MERERANFEDRGRADQHLESLLIATRRGRRAAAEDRRELHICPHCSSDFVYPLDWSQAGDQHWAVDLRCPECEWHGSGVYGQDVLDRFDVELDAGTAAVINDLADLTRANMEDEVDRFVTALRRDVVLPEDF